MSLINLNNIQEANLRLKNIISYNSLSYAPKLSNISKYKCFLKKENLQLTGSFKIRGAFNKIAFLKEQDLKNNTNFLSHGVICSSAGNHAQGVAFSSNYFKTKSLIVMPESTPLLKISSTKEYGAEVILFGNNYDEAYEHANMLSLKTGATFIHPFADREVMAGQGTIALEMIEEEDLDAVIMPIGGGGLISGVASAYKALNPTVKIIGVNAKGANAMSKSFAQKSIINLKTVRTIADGIAVRDVHEWMFSNILEGVDYIVEVDDEEIASAILYLLENQKLIVEGAGAVGLAAVLHNKISFMERESKIGIILSGGNIDVTMLNVIIEKGLLKSDRKIKIQVILIDKPGSLEKLSKILSKEGANIVYVNHSRISTKLEYGDANITLEIEIKGREHKENIFKTLTDNGYNFFEII